MPSKPSPLRYVNISLILEGNRPLVPYHGLDDLPFHFPPDRPIESEDRNWPRESCPTCHGTIGDRLRLDPDDPEGEWVVPQLDNETFCLWCGSMSPAAEARAGYERRVDSARPTAAERLAVADVEILTAEREVERRNEPLSESERRSIWNGGKGSIYKSVIEADAQHNSLAVAGRAFLERIHQLPDWDLILGAKGRVIGRWSDLDAWMPVAETECPGSAEVLWRLFHGGERPADIAFALQVDETAVRQISRWARAVLVAALVHRPAA